MNFFQISVNNSIGLRPISRYGSIKLLYPRLNNYSPINFTVILRVQSNPTHHPLLLHDHSIICLWVVVNRTLSRRPSYRLYRSKRNKTYKLTHINHEPSFKGNQRTGHYIFHNIILSEILTGEGEVDVIVYFN